MPELIRPNWGGYYKIPVGTQLLGLDWAHTYDCGTFLQDGIEYQLLFVFMYKVDLKNTPGLQESFDLHLGIVDDILTNGLEEPLPSIKLLIDQDTGEGLDGWAIWERRIGVMIPEFCGFTFAEVLENFPDILQHLTVEVEGVEITTANIWANNLEDGL